MDLKETLVIDDVIPKNFQDQISKLVLGSPSWFFVDDMSYSSGREPFPSYGFNMLIKAPNGQIVSSLYEPVCVPIVNAIIEQAKIEVKDIHATRAFLQVPLDDKFVKEHNGVHVDIPEPHYACVYYVEDSDGDTIVYEQNIHNTKAGSKNVELVEHKRVTPKKGRVVIFDGSRYHCSSQPKDKYRCIINFVLV